MADIDAQAIHYTPFWKRALVLVVLSAMIAAFSTWQLDSYERSRIEWEQTVTERQKTIAAIVETMMERHGRSVLLQSSLLRNASEDEIQARKTHYDHAYVRWNATRSMYANKLKDTEVADLAPWMYRFITRGVTTELFQPIDQCLTKSYDQRTDYSRAVNTLEECNLTDLLQTLRDCAETLSEFLYSASDVKSDKDNILNERVFAQECRVALK